MCSCRTLFFSVLALLLAMPLAAQSTAEPEIATFVTRLGADTLAVEHIRSTPERIEATVVLRTPRTTVTHYTLDLDAAGHLTAYEAVTVEAGAVDETAPLRRETVVRTGDSLHVQVTTADATRMRTFAAAPDALPFIDMVHWPFDLMLSRAQATGQPRVDQPLFTERGVQTFGVEANEGVTMTVIHPYRGTMAVEVDSRGRLVLLDASNTTRKLTVQRVDDLDVEALAARFAARDAAGQPFGPLAGRGATEATVDGASITVDFGQPAQRGRDLFGALVPWGEVWRTGANRATHFQTDRALMFGDVHLPAGEYTLFSIPEPEGGVLIINRQTGQNGMAYDAEQDFARIPMTLSTLETPVELFTIDVEDTPAGGLLALRWGTTQLAVPFSVMD